MIKLVDFRCVVLTKYHLDCHFHFIFSKHCRSLSLSILQLIKWLCVAFRSHNSTRHSSDSIFLSIPMHILRTLLVYWLWLVLGSFARPNQTKPSMKNSNILKVSAHSHSPTLIEDLLREVYHELFPLANYVPTRSCVTGTSITYQYKSSEYIYIDHPASECRLNIDSQFLAVIKPKDSVHYQINKDNVLDLVLQEVQDAMVYRIRNSADYDINFFNFDNLNYNLECAIDYYEIGQVMFREQCLKVTLEKNVQIGPECGFGSFSNNDDDESCLKSYEYINIPINGTFYCAAGRSASCKRSTAVTKNAHLRNVLGSY